MHNWFNLPVGDRNLKLRNHKKAVIVGRGGDLENPDDENDRV